MVQNNVFKPKFFKLFKKGKYNKEFFISDLIAGIIVGIIALPLAIAFGIASGVTPQQGLITAIVAGLIIALFGGSRFLIGGPTGAFIVIIASIIAKYGMTGLTIATLMAGVFLIVMGVLKMGAVFKFIPYPIIVGFTSGIALTIFSTQLKDFFGFTNLNVPAEFIPQWGCYLSNIANINWIETILSFICLLSIIFWNKYATKKIPGALIAIMLGTFISIMLKNYWGIEITTIGSKFPALSGGMALPEINMPSITYETVKGLVSPAFTIAMLCAIESLLAAMVADGVTGKQHHSNTELIAQGMANLVTPLFGGIPATGALARTMASINNGGKSSVAGLVHSIVLLLIFLFLMPYVVYVPIGCLAAILIIVAYNMSEWRSFKYLLKGEKGDVAVLLITFFLTVVVDLTVAIEFGILLAVVLFVRRIMQTSSISVIKADTLALTEDDDIAQAGDIEKLDIHSGIEVYEINGPYFFGLASVNEDMQNREKKHTVCRIIRMRKVPFIDSTGIRNLRNLCDMAKKRGVQVILSGVQPEVMATLKRFGLDKEVGLENIFDNIIPALSYANNLADKKFSEKGDKG